MPANFTDVLNIPFENVNPPRPLPVGQYLAMISDQPEITQRGKNNTPCVIFPIKLIQALDTTPAFQQELTDALDGKSLGDVKLSVTQWLTPDSVYRFKIFVVDHLGIEAKNGTEAIAQAPGKQLIATIGHYVTNREGEAPRVGMEIKSTARA